jgi:hypothetical protein
MLQVPIGRREEIVEGGEERQRHAMQDVWMDPEALQQIGRLLQVVGVSLLAGWLAELMLDSGLRARGGVLLIGLAGLYLGSWAVALTGWSTGPAVADHALVPTMAGALAVAGMTKLVVLGATGPRR